jgi:aminoglycoside phosphotransferase (APT) family kinase protein
MRQDSIQTWLHAVASAHAGKADEWTEHGIQVRRIAGGYNNILYRVENDGQRCAVKLCVPDERRRAAREYGTLQMLHATGRDIAPRPLHLDETGAILPFPAVVYRWLPGETLGPILTQEQLAALLESYHRMHALRQRDHVDAGLSDAWFHWFDLQAYLPELGDRLLRYGRWLETADPDGPALCERLIVLVDRCIEFLITASVNVERDAFPLCLCRVDQNLANAVWDGDAQLRWVDWEYSGWGDPALDVAELRWHAALADLSEAQHAWLREHYRRPADDPGFELRLAVWDRLIVTRWALLTLRALWSVYNGPDRPRLAEISADPAQLRAQLVCFIARAEQFNGSM